MHFCFGDSGGDAHGIGVRVAQCVDVLYREFWNIVPWPDAPAWEKVYRLLGGYVHAL